MQYLPFRLASRVQVERLFFRLARVEVSQSGSGYVIREIALIFDRRDSKEMPHLSLLLTHIFSEEKTLSGLFCMRLFRCRGDFSRLLPIYVVQCLFPWPLGQLHLYQ